MASTSSVCEMKANDPRLEDWAENILGELKSGNKINNPVKYYIQSDHENDLELELSQNNQENAEVELE